MRSLAEVKFRARQETANALLCLSSPKHGLKASSPLELFPDPQLVTDGLRDSTNWRALITIADGIVQGRVPLFGTPMDFAPRVAWRRDSQRGLETSRKYFRRVPYLDPSIAGDHKLIWEINRHQHLVLLAQAYAVTLRDAYYETVVRQLEHWWEENPFQRGINWTSALEVGFRALSWIWIWHLLGAKMPAAFRQRFLAELYRHGLHLEYNLSIYFSPNTHLLGEAVALHALGRLFPTFPRAPRWRETATDILRRHMETCVQADGSYFEQSTYYHLYALDMFLFHGVLEDMPAAYRGGLSRMAEFLASVIGPGGELPYLGDDDGGRFFSPFGTRSRFARGTLATASVLLGERFFAYTVDDLDEMAVWWLGPNRCKTEPAQIFETRSRMFPDFGVAAIRRGSLFALFDAGSFGPGSGGHSHSDTLSLVVTKGESEIFIDPGTYNYMDSEWREAFRGSAAHNTVRIDGQDQGVPANPFRWAQKPEVKLLEFTSETDKDRVVAICSYRGFTHRRTIEFFNEEFTLADEIEGPGGDHDIEQFWHFASDPRELGPGIWSFGELGIFDTEDGTLEEGWRSRSFGSKEPAPVIVVRRRTTLPVTLHARFRLGSR